MAKDENDFATGVVNTGGKLSSTLVANLPPVFLVPELHIDSLRIFEKNRNDSNFIFRGFWKNDSRKKT
jgi:hypothetical protein